MPRGLIVSLLIVLASTASAQKTFIPPASLFDRPVLNAATERARQPVPMLAMRRFRPDTAQGQSRRRQIIGAAIGAVIGAVPGGVYAFLESNTGCKTTAGADCRRQRNLWTFPVGGAVLGGFIGAAIAR